MVFLRIDLRNVSYGSSVECGEEFALKLKALITEHELSDVCDVGGGANPVLDQGFLTEHNLRYSLLDISQTELDKAPSNFDKVCADITQFEQLPSSQWDLVFSQTLAEHVNDARAFHRNIYKALKPGGYAIHLFPTLFAFPFVLNRLLPERVGSWVLDRFVPRDRYQNDKFPAYYQWCFGPTEKMLNRLETIGYNITEYRGLFGHRYYGFLPPLQKLQNYYADFLIKHPNPYHTSYVILILRKPL